MMNLLGRFAQKLKTFEQLFLNLNIPWLIWEAIEIVWLIGSEERPEGGVELPFGGGVFTASEMSREVITGLPSDSFCASFSRAISARRFIRSVRSRASISARASSAFFRCLLNASWSAFLTSLKDCQSRQKQNSTFTASFASWFHRSCEFQERLPSHGFTPRAWIPCLFLIETSAPRVHKSCTSRTWTFLAAWCNAVLPFASRIIVNKS